MDANESTNTTPDEHHPTAAHHGHHEPQAHDHGAGHQPEGAEHHHQHATGVGGVLGAIFHFHQHEVSFGSALESNADGIRTLWASLIVLLLTASFQLAIALLSGSVGLLADTIHNFSDALTAVPLWLAFVVGRRPPNRQYTYGYGRAEDVAGVVIVLVILVSAGVAIWESYRHLIHPTGIQDAGWVMLAALIGFAGNEIVAFMRTRTGRRIGSAALETDGAHARVDGLTSLGVLGGVVAVLLGVQVADPIVGLLISLAILVVSKGAAVAMWHRLLDAVDPALVDEAEHIAREAPGVLDVHDLRLRWVGHRLDAGLHVTVDEDATLGQAHAIAEDVRHRLFHALPRLADASIHVDPCGHSGTDHHGTTAHHRSP